MYHFLLGDTRPVSARKCRANPETGLLIAHCCLMRLEIEYPPHLPAALQETREQFEAEARMAMAVKLFELKRISSGIAAQLAGMPRAEFLLALHRYGVAMLDLADDELLADAANA